MNNQIIPFAFKDCLVRTVIDENGEPWFVAKDVCAILDIKDHHQMIEGLDEDELSRYSIPTQQNGTVQNRNFSTVSESGLYFLIFRSRKKEAQVFRKWVTSKVLPSLRKSGLYSIKATVPKPPLQIDDYPIIEDAKYLRPTLRQKIWQDAIQTARLDNGTSEDVLRWFEYLCRMMNNVPLKVSPEQHVRDFFFQCFEEAQGCRVKALDAYERFRLWYVGKGDLPSQKSFSLVMQNLVERVRSNGSHYVNVKLRD